MCTVETGTTTVSTSSDETTKYSCQDNAERGWIISCLQMCVYIYVCVCVCTVHQRRHGFASYAGDRVQKPRIYEIRFTSYSLLIEGIGETRGFLKKTSAGGERRMRQGGRDDTVTMLVDPCFRFISIDFVIWKSFGRFLGENYFDEKNCATSFFKYSRNVKMEIIR